MGNGSRGRSHRGHFRRQPSIPPSPGPGRRSVVRRCVAVDAERVSRVSGLQAVRWRDRRIQWKVDVRSVGASRSIVRHAAFPCAPDVSQLFPERCPLAVHRTSIGERCMTPTRLGNTSGLRIGQYPAAETIRAEVLRGLLGHPKTLPPKLFYDRPGARLFEAICELPEYYLTRTELGILRHRAEEIAQRCGENTALIEYGSGAGVKVRLLLDHLRNPAAYVPVDISMEQLTSRAGARARQYPHLSVAPVCAAST